MNTKKSVMLVKRTTLLSVFYYAGLLEYMILEAQKYEMRVFSVHAWGKLLAKCSFVLWFFN